MPVSATQASKHGRWQPANPAEVEDAPGLGVATQTAETEETEGATVAAPAVAADRAGRGECLPKNPFLY